MPLLLSTVVPHTTRQHKLRTSLRRSTPFRMETPSRTPSWLKARSLRAKSTDAERRLWQELRSRRLMGWRFRRQQPIGPYIVDFVCMEQHLIVEVDG